ncbi:MAG: carboxypeptidase regulatory-like domain-containing protein [Myxococcales bacterium]|nr:carboxypeptidase regulatory-like domain-containing protein [Myxococcales bacterium]
MNDKVESIEMTPPTREQHRFSFAGADYLAGPAWVMVGRAGLDDGWEIVEPPLAASTLARAARLDPELGAVLRRIDDSRTVLLRRQTPRYSTQRSESLAAQEHQGEAEPQSEAKLDWIEILIEDEAGEPVRNVRCLVTLPDGSERHARTDSNGLIRYDGIPSGNCSISVLDVDGSAWQLAD